MTIILARWADQFFIMTLLTLEPCEPGYHSPDGLSPCNICPKGTYQPKMQRSVCIQCKSGIYGGKEGATSNADCPSKSFLASEINC